LSTCRTLIEELSGTGDEILARVATEITTSREHPDVRVVVKKAIGDRISGIQGRILTVLEDARVTMETPVGALAERFGSAPELVGLPKPRSLPGFDVDGITNRLEPGNGPSRWVPSRLRKRQVSGRIREQLEDVLRDALVQHQRRLQTWCQDYLADLTRAYEVNAGPFREITERASAPPTAPDRVTLLRDIAALEGGSGDGS